MSGLSREIQELNSRLLQDNKRILQLLASLSSGNLNNFGAKVEASKEDFYRKEKADRSANHTHKIIKGSKEKCLEKSVISSSSKTIKRFNSSESTTVIQRCSSCKLLKKNSCGKSISQNKDRKPQPKNWLPLCKKQTTMIKLKKLSEKMAPRIPSKFIYAKKAKVAHFEKT